MSCLFGHDWGWPRKRGSKHIQTCVQCGSERESLVKFESIPEPHPNPAAESYSSRSDTLRSGAGVVRVHA